MIKYAKDFDEDDSFLIEFEELKKTVENYVKIARSNKYN